MLLNIHVIESFTYTCNLYGGNGVSLDVTSHAMHVMGFLQMLQAMPYM
jgi:hypothetical protein